MNFQNLKRLKNREDGSDFDDFWMQSLTSVQTFFSQIFARTKKQFAATKKFCDARTIERTRCQKVSGKRRSRIVIDGYKIDAVMSFKSGEPSLQIRNEAAESPRATATIFPCLEKTWVTLRKYCYVRPVRRIGTEIRSGPVRSLGSVSH